MAPTARGRIAGGELTGDQSGCYGGARESLHDLARSTGARGQGQSDPCLPRDREGRLYRRRQYGDGALRKGNKTVAYYRSVAASYGFEAGVQAFSYALFFMDEESLSYLAKSDGWELGIGPSIVIVDEGIAKNLSTTTLQKGVYAFVFGQEGLMAGAGLQGTKITRIHPGR